jgi:hypothetical protein
VRFDTEDSMVNRVYILCVKEIKNIITHIENRDGLKLKAALQLLIYPDDTKLLEENLSDTKTQKLY